MSKHTGKVALVTGGSTGIGLATAKRLAEEGATVYVTGRRKPELEAAVQEIGRGAIGVQADSAQLADLDRLYARIREEHGHLDILFANAGVGEMGAFAEVTEEQYDRTFDINVKGVFFTVQKALPLLRDGSSVILNASIVSIKGFGNLSVYSATKAALRSFARTWVVDLKGRGIRINAVSPGPIATPGLAGLAPAEIGKDAFFAHQAGLVPLGRLGEADEIAKAVSFLAGADSSFITGTELFVDGGAAQI